MPSGFKCYMCARYADCPCVHPWRYARIAAVTCTTLTQGGPGSLRWTSEVCYQPDEILRSSAGYPGPLDFCLVRIAQSFFDADIVVPVPLESRSKKVRGYNQARDLAVGVACKICLPLTDILVRKAPREHQARLDRSGRWQNLRGTMETRDSRIIRGARVLVVDDVITTGATLDEAARGPQISRGYQSGLCDTCADFEGLRVCQGRERWIPMGIQNCRRCGRLFLAPD